MSQGWTVSPFSIIAVYLIFRSRLCFGWLFLRGNYALFGWCLGLYSCGGGNFGVRFGLVVAGGRGEQFGFQCCQGEASASIRER